MLRRIAAISLVILLAAVNISAQVHKSIEIFDVKQGLVVKKLDVNPVVQKEAESYLKGISGMYVKVKAFPEAGYIVRIPLATPVRVQNEWLDASVNEVFIILPGGADVPYLLVLDEKGRPEFYNFKGKTDTLLEKLEFVPDALQQGSAMNITLSY